MSLHLYSHNHSDNSLRKNNPIKLYILELIKKFIKHMLELTNITLTAFLVSFMVAIIVSFWIHDWNSAIACSIVFASILAIKYYSWKKQINETTPNKTQKVIVIKRK